MSNLHFYDSSNSTPFKVPYLIQNLSSVFSTANYYTAVLTDTDYGTETTTIDRFVDSITAPDTGNNNSVSSNILPSQIPNAEVRKKFYPGASNAVYAYMYAKNGVYYKAGSGTAYQPTDFNSKIKATVIGTTPTSATVRVSGFTDIGGYFNQTLYDEAYSVGVKSVAFSAGSGLSSSNVVAYAPAGAAGTTASYVDITIGGLNPDTGYAFYGFVSTTRAFNVGSKMYPIGSSFGGSTIAVTTPSFLNGVVTSSADSPTGGTITIPKLKNTSGLDGNVYLTTSDFGAQPTSISALSSKAFSTSAVTAFTIDGLDPQTTVYGYYAYVKMSGGKYYRLSSTPSFTTPSYSASRYLPSDSVLQASITIRMTNLNYATNLSSNLYVFLGTQSIVTSRPSIYFVGYHNGSYGSVTVTGLSTGAAYNAGTYGLYVYNSSRQKYYFVAPVPSFTTVGSYANTVTGLVSPSSVKASVSMRYPNGAPANDGALYLSADDTTESTGINIFKQFTLSQETPGVLSNLSASTTYALYLYLRNPSNSRYYKVGYVVFTTYPAAFTWTYAGKDTSQQNVAGARKTSGMYYCLTATEWNAFTAAINAQREYAGKQAYAFTAAASGGRVFERHVNEAIEALNGLPNHGELIPYLTVSPYSWKVTHALVTASTYNVLMDALNSVIPEI